MKRRPLVGIAVIVFGVAWQPLLAQNVAPALDENGRPIPRAIPVERPKVAPKPVRPADTLPPADLEEPGSIRIAPTTTPRSPDEVQLDIANGYYAQKKYDQAAPEYERYLGMYPTAPGRPDALFRLGESYRHNGANNAARSAYDNLLTQFPNNDFVGPAAYRLADIYYAEKQYREAVTLYRRASVRLKDPGLVNAAKFFTGRALEGYGDKIEARLAYEDVLSATANNPFRDAARYSLAMLLKDAGRTADALKQMQALSKQCENPDLKIEATVQSGVWEEESGTPQQLALAEADFKSALTIPGPSRWKDLAQLGLLRLEFKGGKFQAITDLFEKNGVQLPADMKPDFLMLTADAYHQLGKNGDALKLYDQILKDFPASDSAKDAQFERLRILYATDDPNLVAEIDKYVAANPDGAKRDEALLMKAEVFFKKQDYKTAMPIYSALELSRQLTGNRKGEVIFRLGWCQMELRDFDKAAKAFTTFIEGYPGNKMIPYALIQRGLAYETLKNMASALKDFDTLIRLYPKAKEREVALHQKALILGQQDDTAGMAETFRTLLKDYPNTPIRAQADYWIGYQGYQTKNYKEAVPYLEEARKLDEEQFWEKASIRLLQAEFLLEDRAGTAKEAALYAEKGKAGVSGEILRWLGAEFTKAAGFDNQIASLCRRPGEAGKNPNVTEDLKNAEKYLQMLTARGADVQPDDFLLLGQAERELGNNQPAVEALKTYLKSIKLPRPRALGLLTMADSQIALKALDEAQNSDDEALTLQPEGEVNGCARIVAGDIQMARGNFSEAAKLYESVSTILDNDEVTPAALERAVNAWHQAGDESRSRKTLNTLKSRYPEYLQKKGLEYLPKGKTSGNSTAASP
jgi:TolA-binding protein